MLNIQEIADTADLIVNGYSFTRCTQGFRVLNLNRPDRAVVLSSNGEVLETSMDDIELAIVQDYWKRNVRFLEEGYAEVL